MVEADRDRPETQRERVPPAQAVLLSAKNQSLVPRNAREPVHTRWWDRCVERFVRQISIASSLDTTGLE